MKKADVPKVRKAVIPAAGLGTRLLPATKVIPKEMVPIIDVPMIQYVVEEAVRSGIQEVILVTARGKEAIENHFDHAPELEAELEAKNKKDLLEICRATSRLAKVVSVRQAQPLGLGHAIACAAAVVGGEPFAVLLPDELMDSEVPCLRQLMDVYDRTGFSCVGIMKVPEKDVVKYGIVSGKKEEGGVFRIDYVVEKPTREEAPSNLALPGRYVLTGKAMEYLTHLKPNRGGEIQLTDGLLQLARNEGLLGYEFDAHRYDVADRLGYIEATLALALKRPDLRQGVADLIRKYAEKL